jgi:homocysteine S-methyltransferase
VKPFLDMLAERPILFDGAMGSLLYERGVFHNRSYDEINLSQPDLVQSIHRDYVAAGADVIETNTFGANRLALRKHNEADRVEEINQAAVKNARAAIGDRAYLAGAIGPTGLRFSLATEEERKAGIAALAEQARILAKAGVDLLCLETFDSIQEMEAAVPACRAAAPGLPLVAQMVFSQNGLIENALTPKDVATRLSRAGADVVGANCGGGPPELYQVGTAMVDGGAPVSVQPNAGLPSHIDGRTIYVANPEHFGVFARRLLKAGVRVIGGCCGTTPHHTRAMLGAVRMMGGERTTVVVTEPVRPLGIVPEPKQSLAERSKLGKRLAEKTFVVSVELAAPNGTDAEPLLKRVRELRAGGVDIINIAEGPRASARMSNLAFCARALSEANVEPILHMCGRDRSYLGQIAHLLGAHGLGLRNLVMITGDPPKMGDYPLSTPVYDIDSIGLLSMARALNAGFDPSGKPVPVGATSFVLACGAEPAASDYERELRRLEQKKDAGADLIMTQPVYDPATLDRFLQDVAPLNLPVMVGLLPLASLKNAEFLHNEVPGMQVPQAIRERMARVQNGPDAQREGVRIAQEALSAVADRVAGAYIMPPFNRVESALSILEVLSDRWQPVSANEA